MVVDATAAVSGRVRGQGRGGEHHAGGVDVGDVEEAAAVAGRVRGHETVGERHGAGGEGGVGVEEAPTAAVGRVVGQGWLG